MTGAEGLPGRVPLDLMMPFFASRRRPTAPVVRGRVADAALATALFAALAAPLCPAAAQATTQTTTAQPASSPQTSAGETAVAARPVPTSVTAYTPDATRAQLVARRDSLARVGGSGDEVREIGRRLAAGDFRPGDRFLVQDLVLAHAGAATGATGVGDTVIVREGVSGPVFSLNTWGDTPLRGVLRAELPATVERYERTYVREPRIRVVPLTRVSIIGGVPRPGYYVVDPDRQLTDAITLAGGPGASNQKKGRITILRDSKQIYDTKVVQTAIRDGRTLDDMAIRSGDEIRVEEPKRSKLPSVQTIIYGISALTGLIFLIRSAYSSN